jgi:hypothetical protein
LTGAPGEISTHPRASVHGAGAGLEQAEMNAMQSSTRKSGMVEVELREDERMNSPLFEIKISMVIARTVHAVKKRETFFDIDA